MGRDDGLRIGFFGDVRREEARLALFERVVETSGYQYHRRMLPKGRTSAEPKAVPK
jgi:hypothetical protein